jgi:hypothetical protein
MANDLVPPQAQVQQNSTASYGDTSNTRKFPRIVGVFILVLSLLVSIGVAELARRKRVAERHILARRIISAQIEKFIYSPDVLRLAARQHDISPGNVELSACLLGGSICTATDPMNQVAFGLRSQMESQSDLLIGTVSNPANYSSEGAPGCDDAEDPSCPGWTVKAWFWAECTDKAVSCPIAGKIHVRYQVAPGPQLSHLAASPGTSDLQSDPYAYAETISVNRL